MPNVTIGRLNTLAIAAASGVYRLKYPSSGPNRKVELTNIGPGVVYIRMDADPATNDPASLQVPVNGVIRDFTVDSGSGLGVIAAADATITIRML